MLVQRPARNGVFVFLHDYNGAPAAVEALLLTAGADKCFVRTTEEKAGLTGGGPHVLGGRPGGPAPDRDRLGGTIEAARSTSTEGLRIKKLRRGPTNTEVVAGSRNAWAQFSLARSRAFSARRTATHRSTARNPPCGVSTSRPFVSPAVAR